MKRLSVDTLWTPELINTVGWFDASDASTITESSNNVSQWDDKSGNGNNLVQLSSSNQPSYATGQINGVSALVFKDATETVEYLDIETDYANFEWVAIVLTSTAVRFSQACGSQTLGSGANYTIQYRGDTSPDRWQNPYYTNGNPISILGASAILGAGAIAINDNLALTDFDFNVGSDRGIEGRGWDGAIGEVICGGTTLDTATRETIEGYLAHKWGFVSDLPALHPYKSVPPLA